MSRCIDEQMGVIVERMFVEDGMTIADIAENLGIEAKVVSKYIGSHSLRGKRAEYLASRWRGGEELRKRTESAAIAEQLTDIRAKVLGIVQKTLDNMDSNPQLLSGKALASLAGLLSKVEGLCDFHASKARKTGGEGAVAQVADYTPEEFAAEMAKVSNSKVN